MSERQVSRKTVWLAVCAGLCLIVAVASIFMAPVGMLGYRPPNLLILKGLQPEYAFHGPGRSISGFTVKGDLEATVQQIQSELEKAGYRWRHYWTRPDCYYFLSVTEVQPALVEHIKVERSRLPHVTSVAVYSPTINLSAFDNWRWNLINRFSKR